MKIKTSSFILLFTFFSISFYAQEGNNNRVTIEDQGASEEWKENDDKYRALDKELSDLMKYWNKLYANLRRDGFNRLNGDMSKNNLTNFVNQAEKFKSDLRNNPQIRRLQTELNNLAKKTSRSTRNSIEDTYINPKILSVEGDISSAKGFISDIEANESKKELSVGFGNSTSSSSNPNNTTSSSSGSQTSTSVSDNYYQNALERQRVYEQNLQIAANNLVDVGVSIVNQIQQARVDRINYNNKQNSEYLNRIMSLDKECAQLYNTNYQKFLLKEKELRKYENWTISNLNWLIDKVGNPNYKNLKKEISANQKLRLKKILEYNTNQHLAKSNKINKDFMNLFISTYVEEINDYTIKYSVDNKEYSSISRGFKNEQDWRNFVDEEQKIRAKKILELNKTKKVKIFDEFWEVAFYLFNNYEDAYYDNKTTKYLKSLTSPKSKFYLADWAMYNTKYTGKEAKLLLLLGDGNQLNYYLDINQDEDKKPKALYDYINDRDNNGRFIKSKELVNSWVSKDEESSGKKAKVLFAERKGCLTANCNDSKSNMSSLINEAKAFIEQKKYNKAATILQMGISLYPENPLMYYYSGIVKSLEKNIFHSIKKSIDKKVNASLAENMSKNDKEAIEYFNKGIDYAKDNEKLLLSFYNRLGNIYNKVEEFDKSDEAFNKALKIDPNNPLILNNYSWALTERIQNLELAEQMIKLCNEKEPDNYNYQDTYAWNLYKQGRYVEADNWLNKSITNGGKKDSNVWEHKGDISYKLGKKEEALMHWRNAKIMSKSNGGEVSEFLNQKIKKKRLIE